MGTARALSSSLFRSSDWKDVCLTGLTHDVGGVLAWVLRGVLVLQRWSEHQVPSRHISSLVLAPIAAAVVWRQVFGMAWDPAS